MADEPKVDETDSTADETATKSEELGAAGKRALEAERKRARQAEKELKAIREQLKEREDADKSELERLQERAAQEEKRAEDAEAKVIRSEVAAAKGLSAAQAKRLVGSTREELEADADEMRTELGLNKDDEKKDDEKDESTDESVFGRKPEEKLRAGASNEEDEGPDAAKLADSILDSRF